MKLKRYITIMMLICSVILIGGIVWFIVAMINNNNMQVGFAVCVMLFGWGIANMNIGFYRIVRKEKEK